MIATDARIEASINRNRNIAFINIFPNYDISGLNVADLPAFAEWF